MKINCKANFITTEQPMKYFEKMMMDGLEKQMQTLIGLLSNCEILRTQVFVPKNISAGSSFMSVGRIIWNCGTSAVFGPGKYVYKFLAEPEKRGRNALFFATSFFGTGVIWNLLEEIGEMGESAGDVIDSNANSGDIPPFLGMMPVSPSAPSNMHRGLDIQAFVQQYLAEQKLETINNHLEGLSHPVTGVEFADSVVEIPESVMEEKFLDGYVDEQDFYYPDDDDDLYYKPIYAYDEDYEPPMFYDPETGEYYDGDVEDFDSEPVLVEGVFPIFDSYYDFQLPEQYYLASDDFQFRLANSNLYHNIVFGTVSAEDLGFTSEDIMQLKAGETPVGLVWHHNEQPGKLQLIDEEVHANTAHTGGRSIWGGGTEFR